MKPTPKYTSRPTSGDPRDTEAWALTEAARRLVDAGRDPDNHDALRSALQLNQRLWTIFQAAISEEDCPLPRELRTNIAALSLMVDRETIARLVDLDPAKLDLLVNINRNVAGGLAQRSGVAATTAPIPAPPQAASVQRPAAEPAAPLRESLRISI